MRTPISTILLIAGFLLAASPLRAQADTTAADSLAADTTQVDSLMQTTSGVDVVTLADSAKLKLDSAAVAVFEDTTEAISTDLSEGTPVLFFGRTLFRVYGPLGELSEEARAARITQRLEQIASNANANMDSLRVVEGQEFTTIQLADFIIVTVTTAEAKALLLPRNRVAIEHAELIKSAVARHREQLTARGLFRSAVISVLLLIVLVIVLRSLGWFYDFLARRTESLRTALIRPIVFRGNILVSRSQIESVASWLFRVTRVGIALFIIYMFLTSVFGLFPWTQAWSERLLSYVVAPLAGFGNLVVDGAPNLLAIAVIVVIVRWLIKISNYFFERIRMEEFHIPGFYPELAEPTRRIARFLLVILGFMLIYPYTPIAESRVFQGLTVFFGILLSLGSSSAISNIIAGVVLTYTRAFRLGDRVKMGDTFGDVVEKTFLVTRIRTPKNEDVAVPNSMALSDHIINYSQMCREGDGVILHSTVTIGYDVPWPKVHELLIESAKSVEGFEAEPPPFVLQNSLGDYSVAYQINAYTKEVNRMMPLYSDLHAAIQDAFNRAGVEILSPMYNAFRDGNKTTNPVRSDLGPSAEELSRGADGEPTG
ncbi:MAG: mechanosensitive ion channel family protein [Rubricoccaceae bacterium]|nr:mechanosensitive ion channel family protein [Rubricoccaceae bacterium]